MKLILIIKNLISISAILYLITCGLTEMNKSAVLPLENGKIKVLVPDEYCIYVSRKDIMVEEKNYNHVDGCGDEITKSSKRKTSKYIGIKKTEFLFYGEYKPNDLDNKIQYFYSGNGLMLKDGYFVIRTFGCFFWFWLVKEIKFRKKSR